MSNVESALNKRDCKQQTEDIHQCRISCSETHTRISTLEFTKIQNFVGCPSKLKRYHSKNNMEGSQSLDPLPLSRSSNPRSPPRPPLLSDWIGTMSPEISRLQKTQLSLQIKLTQRKCCDEVNLVNFHVAWSLNYDRVEHSCWLQHY